MDYHDLIVIGASAGGVGILQRLCATLPRGLPAAVCIAQHIAPAARSVLPDLLSRAGPLPASHPVSGTPLNYGQIYIAPPDHHLMIDGAVLRLSRGARENRTRPAADVLFRSAAASAGPRVIGVVLSGTLDDGAAGLVAIKRCGGLTIVQDPGDAPWPDMPRNALLRDHADHIIAVAEMGALLARLARTPAGTNPAVPEDIVAEVRIAMHDSQDAAHAVGSPSRLSCPECGGVLNEIEDDKSVRFRCQLGHAYGPQSLMAAQHDGLELALVTALRTHRERLVLFERMMAAATNRGHTLAAQQWDKHARQSRDAIDLISNLLAQLPLSPPDPKMGRD